MQIKKLCREALRMKGQGLKVGSVTEMRIVGVYIQEQH